MSIPETSPKRGRPAEIEGEQTTMRVRLSVAHRDKVDRLGGAAWIRARIEEAPEPQEGSRALGPWLSNNQGDTGCGR